MYDKQTQQKVSRHDIQQDGGAGASEKMRKKEIDQIFTDKVENY